MSDPDDQREYQDLPDAVKSCEKSVREDNPDMDRETAIAICQDLDNQGKLAEPDDDVDREASHDVRVHRGLASIGGDTVRRVENDDGSVTYTNLAILAPGEWTDAASEQTIFYSPEAISRIAENPDEHVVDTSINVNHEHQDQLAQVGQFDPDSVTTDDESILYADLTLHGRTSASEDTIELIDLALESDGEQGAGGPSVEIPREGEVTEWDRERNMERMVEFNLSGLAIVTQSASMDVGFDKQFAERPVAMADGSDAEVRVMQAGQTVLSGIRQADDMEQLELEQEQLADAVEAAGEDTTLHVLEADGEAVTIEVEADSVGAIEDAIGTEEAGEDTDDEPGQELQGEDALQMVDTLLSEFLQENDADAPASEFVAFVEEQTDAEPGDVQPVLEAYLEATGAESLEETPVGDLQGFVESELEGEGGNDEEENGNEEEMQEKLSELEEDKRELQNTLEDLEKRLSTIEDEPKDTKSHRETARPSDDEETSNPAPAAGQVQKRNGWISR